MKLKEAKQIIESEFGDLRKENRSQYDTLISLLVKYGADESRPLEKLVMPKNYDLMLSGVDEEIRGLVDALNKNGFETIASCSGHGKMMGNIALRDGREIMIIENYEKARNVEKTLIANRLYEPINK